MICAKGARGRQRHSAPLVCARGRLGDSLGVLWRVLAGLGGAGVGEGHQLLGWWKRIGALSLRCLPGMLGGTLGPCRWWRVR